MLNVTREACLLAQCKYDNVHPTNPIDNQFSEEYIKNTYPFSTVGFTIHPYKSKFISNHYKMMEKDEASNQKLLVNESEFIDRIDR